MNAKIYKFTLGLTYTCYNISIIIIANNIEDAKNKILVKCLEKYDEIKNIDFKMFYCSEDCDSPPLSFKNKSDLEKYILDNLNDNHIDCLETCDFEIVNRYDI